MPVLAYLARVRGSDGQARCYLCEARGGAERRRLDDEDAQPLHVGRFGRQIDAQGVMEGSPDSDRCIGYLTKYLVKDIAECHQAESAAQADHADRLLEALRYEPCSPTCANWLRYGVQPKNARPLRLATRPPDDPDVRPVEQRLLAAIAERIDMRRQLDHAKTTLDLPATPQAA